MIRLSPLGLIALALPATAGEGSSILGESQRLKPGTILRVDIINETVESIIWTATYTNDDIPALNVPVRVNVTDPLGYPRGNFGSGARITVDMPGVWLLEPVGQDLWTPGVDGGLDIASPDGVNDPITTWDIEVEGAAPGRGRVSSLKWRLDTGSFRSPFAFNGSWYTLVNGGAPGLDAVIEMAAEGLTGNEYDLNANGQGAVSGAITANGRSTPLAGWDVPDEFPLYLLPPAVARFNSRAPTITTPDFTYDEACGVVGSGIASGTLSFESNVDGTWHLLCDANRDGVYDLSSDDDVHVVGRATIGLNEIPWDGTANDGTPVDPGAYDCIVKLTVGEYHFVANDIETAFEGVRMFRVRADLNREGLPMYWNDIMVQDGDVLMPDGQVSRVSSGPTGVNAGAYSDPFLPNVNSRAWGDFTRFGKGDATALDTFTWLSEANSSELRINVADSVSDDDRDRLPNTEELCVTLTDPGNPDSDDDGLLDGDEVLDVFSNPLDPDSDDDGALDGEEIPDPTSPRDSDLDGVNNALDDDDDNDRVPSRDEDWDGVDGPENDDEDGDGLPDYLDPDHDGDGLDTVREDWYTDDGSGSCPLTAPGDGSPLVDDTDCDGLPNHRDTDDDNDGVLTVDEGDGDADRFERPSGTADLSGGCAFPDTDDCDGDGLYDFLDVDDDGDRVSTRDEGTDDLDGDGFPNYRDIDDDGDGAPTAFEDADRDGNGNNDDSDLDGTPDWADDDDDGDGVLSRDDDPDGSGDITDDDADGDGIPDFRDTDDDNDGVLSVDEDLNGDGDPRTDDSDGDGLPDYLDPDDDGDSVPSIDEVGDTDGDGIVDRLDTDDDGDGILTADEDPDGDGVVTNHDRDGDGLPNYLDDDDDGDGIPTQVEGQVNTDGDEFEDYLDYDSDGDGQLDEVEGVDDLDADGSPNYLDLDDDGDSLLTADEGSADRDEDGTPDFLDPDDDGDGIPTLTEITDAEEFGEDPDADGIPSWYDLDSDADRLKDAEEGGENDVDGDGIPDYLDPIDPTIWYQGGCPGLSVTGSAPSALLALLTLLALRRRRS